MASISSPSSLANFQNARASSSKSPHVALSEVYGSEGGLAVAAVNGDGIWTYDLATLRPTASFTVPPSTVFSTPALSYIPTKRDSRAGKEKAKAKIDAEAMATDGEEATAESSGPGRVTLVAVQEGDGISGDKAGKVIWRWDGGDEAEQRVIEVDIKSRIQALYELNNERYPVLVVSEQGELLALAGTDSAPVSITLDGLSNRQRRIIASAPIAHHVHSAEIAMLSSDAHLVHVKLEFAGEGISSRIVSERSILADKDAQISLRSAEISRAGSICALDSTDHIIQVDVRHGQTVSAAACPRLASDLAPSVVPLASIGKPLVLMAVNGSSPALVLATPSPDLPAVVTDSALSALPTVGPVAALSVLARPSSSTYIVGFVVSHVSTSSGDKSGRSVIYTSEITLPERGIGLKDLLGSQALTNRYFASTAPAESSRTPADQRGADLVGQLRSILAGAGERHAIAARAEQAWITQVSAEGSKLAAKHVDGLLTTSGLLKAVVGAVFSAALPAHQAEDAVEEGATISRAPATGPYAKAIVTDLLKRGYVSDEMWAGGLIVGGLIPCGDWDNVLQALQIPSISARTIASVLQLSGSATKNHSAPSLQRVYATILSLPSPASTYRAEMRRVVDVEVATQLLACLVSWAELHLDSSVALEEWDAGRTRGERTDSLPSLESVIAHSSLLLDSHLPLFLSHEPAYDLLARLQAALDPLLSLQTQLRKLRAPIEAVLALSKEQERLHDERAQKNATRGKMAATKEGEPKGKKGGKGGKGAKGKKGVVFVDEAEGSVLPGEVMGKWRVEEITF